MTTTTKKIDSNTIDLARAILNRASEILDGGRHWVQHYEARDEQGRAVKPTSPDAVCWCAKGALARARAEITTESWSSESAVALASDAIRTAAGCRHYPEWALTRWNDNIGQTGPSVCSTIASAEECLRG